MQYVLCFRIPVAKFQSGGKDCGRFKRGAKSHFTSEQNRKQRIIRSASDGLNDGKNQSHARFNYDYDYSLDSSDGDHDNWPDFGGMFGALFD